ncbi:hypothetical protein M0R45_016509 [Rubus argutus]|uniref:Dynamin stalk domain-containing protein n=1 Tax=Rubus argutus TaxID=59490 RepID=A0AAW1XV92_RUBAR
MIAARRREREYFANTPEYKHLAHRMGSEHLAKMLSKHLETPIATDAGGKLYAIMEIVVYLMEHIKNILMACVLGVHGLLKDLVHKAVNETLELRQYPGLRAEVTNAACDSLRE